MKNNEVFSPYIPQNVTLKQQLNTKLQVFLNERSTQITYDTENHKQYIYIMRLNQNKLYKITAMLTINCLEQYKFSLAFKFTQEIERMENKVMELVNQFNIKMSYQKICYKRSSKEIQIIVNLPKQLPKQLSKIQQSKQYSKYIGNRLQQSQNYLKKFIQLAYKKQISTKSQLLHLGSRIEILKKVVDNQIKNRQKSKLPAFTNYKIEIIKLNTITSEIGEKQLRHTENILHFQKVYHQDLNLPISQKDQQVLRLIQIHSQERDPKWKIPRSSFGSLTNWTVQYVIDQSIHTETNKFLAKNKEVQNKKIITGPLIQKCPTREDKHSLQSMITETTILKYLRNKFQRTMPCYYLSQSSHIKQKLTNFYMDYYSINLKEYIQNTNGKFCEKQSLNICQMLARNLRFLNINSVMHRDLKPSNIMLTQSLEVKVIDFGSGYIINANKQLLENISEQLKSTKHYNLFHSQINDTPDKIPNKQYNQHQNFDIYAYGRIIDEVLIKRDSTCQLGIALRKHLTWVIHRCTDVNPYNRIDARHLYVLMSILLKYRKILNSLTKK